MKSLLLYMAFAITVTFCCTSEAQLYGDDSARSAVLELRSRIENVNNISKVSICPNNNPNIYVGDERLGEIELNRGDTEARKAIRDLRKRVILLEVSCEIASKNFMAIPPIGFFAGPADDELRRAILDLRQRLEILRGKIKEQIAQKIQNVDSSNLPACQGSDTTAWSNCTGTKTFTNGAKYVGEHKDGKFNGQGTATFANGDKYVGEHKDGKFNGQGTYTFANGDKYVGEYKDDRYNGQGAATFADGSKYVGEWKDDKRSGQGTITFTDGSEYVGEYKDDKRNGQGTLFASNGSIINQGIFADNKFVRSAPVLQATAPAVLPSSAERDRLAAEVEVERKKRQELEQQLALNKERERITEELELERKKRQELEAQLAASVKPSQPQSSAPRRIAHALVIGNAAYPGSGRLDNPVNDANAISQKLRSMGFIVTTVTDANRQRLVQSMAQFRRTAASADISLLYYAGHGVQIFGTNYILPTDVDQTDPAQATIQGVSLNSVVENFLPGKTKLVFLDACRDNALQRTNDRSVSKGLAPISAAEGTLISYATKDGQTAADGVGSKNSPFTQALLEHLNDPQDIAVVLRKVRERVMKITGGKQQPWEYGSLTGGELVLAAIKPK